MIINLALFKLYPLNNMIPRLNASNVKRSKRKKMEKMNMEITFRNSRITYGNARSAYNTFAQSMMICF